MRLELLTTSFIWRLWTVQNGVLSDGLDLLPHTRTHFRDGTSLSAASENHEAIWDRGGDTDAITVDWDAIAQAVPPLHEPRIGPDEVHELWIDTHPAPDAGSVLADGIVLRYGEMDDD